MIESLTGGAAAVTAVSVLLIALLTLRRLTLARTTRERAALERELRPHAMGLIETGTAPAGLDRQGTRVLAGVLGRYMRSLSGDARARIAAFYERSGEVEREVRALRSRRAWRRATAAFLLGDMGSPTAAAPLLERLRTDRSRDVRSAAARSLGRLQAADATRALLEAVVGDRIPRSVGGRSLLALGAPALPGLRELAEHPDPSLRAHAIEMVGHLGNAGDGDLVAGRLRDTSALVRATAARALGRLGSRDHAAALRAALADRVPPVRAAAADALGDIGDRGAAAGLLTQARDDAFDPAQAAARALARIAPDALPAAGADAGPHLNEAADLARARGGEVAQLTR